MTLELRSPDPLGLGRVEAPVQLRRARRLERVELPVLGDERCDGHGDPGTRIGRESFVRIGAGRANAPGAVPV